MKRTKVYAWLDSTHPLFVDLEGKRDQYDAFNNACAIARIFEDCLPGNTVDILLTKIADDIRQVITVENVEMLQSPHYIENRIRGTLERLMELSK